MCFKKILFTLTVLTLLTACGGGGGEEFTPEKLAAPSPELSIAGTKATVTWPKVEHAKGYAYELTKEGVASGSGQLQLPTYTFTLEGQSRYTFRVKAVADKTGMYLDSDFSATINAQLNQLSTPTAQVDAATLSNTSATVSWSAVTGAAAYRYRLKEGNGTPVEKDVNGTSVTLTNLKEATTYTFAVKAIGSGNMIDSDYSKEVTFTTLRSAGSVDLQLPQHEQDGVIRAFPGAEGGGMYTTGGRGGKVYHVTNLNDSGSGSLRAAVEASGKRIIVFDVCGTIKLTKNLNIKNSDITIAGQTAPGEGITLRDYSVVIDADNVIIRYLRFRMGDEKSQENDALWGRYHQNIILDHCSMSWSTDECSSFYANKNFTMQWCLLGESLRNSVHGKGKHGYGGIWGGKNASFHHNMLTCHDSRNARIDHPQIYVQSDKDYRPTHRGHVDYRNNLINNWGSEVTYGGESGWFNIIGNYYKKGPASTERKYFVNAYADYQKDGKVYSDAYGEFYLEGNVNPSQSGITADNKTGVNWKNGSSWKKYNQYLSAPLPICKDDETSCYTTTHTAEDAYARALDYAGASLRRDAVDERLVKDARNGTATYTDGGNGSKNGLIDTQTAVGGWPTLTATDEEVARAKTDSDGDHIPDYYEGLLGLNPSKVDASETTLDPQGLYSNFEIYLHFLVKEITAGQTSGGTYTKLD